MLTLFKVLAAFEIDTASVRLVRHGNKEIPVLETFLNDLPRFEAYQSYQAPKKFGDSTAIAVFAPYHGTTALFLGLWDIQGYLENSDFSEANAVELQKYSLPKDWFVSLVKYKLKRNVNLDDLSERLVIEWGSATVAWVQSKDKKVVEIRPEKSVGEFHSFAEVSLTYQQLLQINRNPDSNYIWIKALSSVNGVYLIRDTRSGDLYVGSAYGEQGIWGRWTSYARDGHGGNLELRKLDPSRFQFSILEIMSATTTVEGVVLCENRWKEKLGTRTHGLNRN